MRLINCGTCGRFVSANDLGEPFTQPTTYACMRDGKPVGEFVIPAGVRVGFCSMGHLVVWRELDGREIPGSYCTEGSTG